jgi:hypothetical protein
MSDFGIIRTIGDACQSLQCLKGIFTMTLMLRQVLVPTMAVVVLLPRAGTAAPLPASVDEYAIHADGGIVYDPLRREAEKTEQLKKYDQRQTRLEKLELGAYRLQFRIPSRADAYDVIPVPYELSWDEQADKPSFPLAIEATAFEDESRRKGRDLFDLTLPGKIDLDIDYLGSVTAHLKPGARHNLKPDFSDTPGEYPGFVCKPLVRSAVVEAGDLVWFKIRYQNSGDTILDPEGMGGCLFYPHLLRKNDKGEYEQIGMPYNLYNRDLEYLYPGESHETWLSFQTNQRRETPENRGLVPGEYLLRVRLVYRCYKTPDVFLNIWDGPEAVVWDMPFSVEKEGREAPVAAGTKTLTDGGDPDKITRFMHTFEEFMTAFDCWQGPSEQMKKAGETPTPQEGKITGTLHLQVAPWTKHVVVKLIDTDPMAVASQAVPITIGTESLAFPADLNPAEYVIRSGKREPMFVSQTMADMRTNTQLGPWPERHIGERLREMLDLGVNVVSTTSMPWLYDDKDNPPSNYNGDAMKYFMDLARREGMLIEGWGTYPMDRANVQDIAAWITGKPWAMDRYSTNGYHAISHADPLLPAASAVTWLYQFHRWGDLYYQSPGGNVPFSVEDTRGWMRQDVNVRLPMGDRSIQAFRDWLKARHQTIEAANAAMGTSFKSFEEINPEANQVPNEFGHRWEYTDKSNPFHDWNDAVAEFDAFRTDLRIRNFRDTLELIRKEVPAAVIVLRTEGANAIVSGLDPRDPNPHLRHVYFSQRRCALVAEQLQQSGVFKYHSDYITLPYTPSEVRELVGTAARQGIVSNWLPQFDNMRDIAINKRYGNDYQVNFNLPEPRKGYMMHVLTAAYPWWKATIESGGVPGILWEDYQCDGFATETQKRELRLFTARLRDSLTEWAGRPNDSLPSQEWRKGSRALPSYRFP